MRGPSFRLRPLQPSDADICATWMVREERLLPSFHNRLREQLRALVAQKTMKGVIIEGIGGRQDNTAVAAIGLSGFARPSIIDRHLADPQPLLMSSLILDQGGVLPFLDIRSVARANASSGLDLVSHLMLRSWDLAADDGRHVGNLAHTAYVKDHRGYRINRALQEDWQRAHDIYLATGYSLHTRFPEGTACSIAEQFSAVRNLYFGDRADIGARAPGSSLSFVLHWVAPRCRFSKSEQRLLIAASHGLTDAQLVDELQLSLNTIKTLWRSIYDRVRGHLPEIFGAGDVDGELGKRGQELRRLVVSYVQEHPEELRPFEKRGQN